MISNIRKLIRESIESTLLCEVKMSIDDEKNRGFADQIGQMYKASLAELKPIRIYGKLGTETPGGEASVFEITLYNGDIIKATRITNPAYAIVSINGEKEYKIHSSELFSNKFPELIKKYYLEYKTAKAGIPSI